MTTAEPLILKPSPLLIVLSGPSGAGKDAVLTELKASGYPMTYVTTVTTRPRRANETNGKDYHFITPGEFETMLAKGEFLEHASVYGNWYGVPKKPVRAALENGQDVTIKVDIQGAATIRKLAPEAVLIFLTPPTAEEIASRLKQRQTESNIDLDLRLATTSREMSQLDRFDYVVLNHKDRISRAVADIKAIITAEKCRTRPRRVSL
jgi:guanylate kinase